MNGLHTHWSDQNKAFKNREQNYYYDSRKDFFLLFEKILKWHLKSSLILIFFFYQKYKVICYLGWIFGRIGDDLNMQLILTPPAM